MFAYAKLFSVDSINCSTESSAEPNLDYVTESKVDSDVSNLVPPSQKSTGAIIPVDFEEIEEELLGQLKHYPENTENLTEDKVLNLEDAPTKTGNVRVNRFSKYDDIMVASRQGDREAQYKLAYAYYEVGEGHSYRTGFNWMMKSARAGYLPAVRDLSLWYCQGIGTAVDPIRSMAWHKLAASFGVAFNPRYYQLRTCNTNLSDGDMKKVDVVFNSHRNTVARNPGW